MARKTTPFAADDKARSKARGGWWEGEEESIAHLGSKGGCSLARSERFWELLQVNMVLGDAFVLWFVPTAAVVGILFALVQWYIVSGVSVGGEGKGNNGYLHVDEDGVSDAEVVAKCAEIQAAISEGAATTLSFCRGVCLEMNRDVVLLYARGNFSVSIMFSVSFDCFLSTRNRRRRGRRAVMHVFLSLCLAFPPSCSV